MRLNPTWSDKVRIERNKTSIKNHKKRLAIACGIVSIFIIVSVVFTNIPNLIYRDVASVFSQIQVSNTFQTYEINTNCELSYRMLDSIHTKNGYHILLIIPPMLYTDRELALSLQQKYADKTNMDDKMDAINKELFEISVKRTMEKNSVNPKLEPKIRMWISSFMAYQYENLKLPLSSQDIAADPECAKKMKMYYPQMVNMP